MLKEEAIKRIKDARARRGLPPYPDSFYENYSRQLEPRKCSACKKRKKMNINESDNQITEGEREQAEKLRLGDAIAKVTSAVGIKPCGGCKKRQAKLNELDKKIRG